MLVDTLGLVLQALVHPANIQDRDGGIELLTALADRFPLLAKLFADGAYQGPQFREGVAKVRPQLATELIGVSKLQASSLSPSAGSSNGHSRGSIGAVAWRRTLRIGFGMRRLSSISLRFA